MKKVQSHSSQVREIKPTRVKILEHGAALTAGERDKVYGPPVVNMQHFAGLLTAYFSNLLDYEFTGEDAAQIMVMAKLSRTANRGVKYHEDNYTDQSVYSAIAGECAQKERES